jgi:hypothetical protein
MVPERENKIRQQLKMRGFFRRSGRFMSAEVVGARNKKRCACCHAQGYHPFRKAGSCRQSPETSCHWRSSRKPGTGPFQGIVLMTFRR